MAFDPTKPVQTRDGRPARIICTDRNHVDGSIVALVKAVTGPHKGEEVLMQYYEDGSYIRGNRTWDADLINVPEVRYEYQNVHKVDREYGRRWPKESYHKAPSAIAVLKYTFEDDKLVSVELTDEYD